MCEASARKAYGEVVWACRPDAGGKFVKGLKPIADDGDTKAVLTRASTYKP